MGSIRGYIIFGILMLLLDLYVFQVVRFLSAQANPKVRLAILVTYWVVSVLAIIILILLPYLNMASQSKAVRSTLFAVVIGLFLTKLIAAVIFLVDDIRRAIQWIVGKLFFNNTEGEVLSGEDGIARSVFLSWLGTGLGLTLYGSLLYGFSNKYNYRVHKVDLSYPNLPEGFKGIRIAQISDVHSGSFTNPDGVRKGIKMVLDLKPDLILFTGDLVNDQATEMQKYESIFKELQAPMGVYSILGNHDYGDYVSWVSPQAKRQNLDMLKEVHARMGWRLLLDENVELKRNNDTIALIGVQNWSAMRRFPKYGNLTKAYQGAEQYPFQLLMSHDPTHWDAEVRPRFPKIDLMLAGHTHGMQFGVEIPGFRWSPVQYVYRQWAGLYQEGSQYLYVNRGYGFLGYPGRVGILPEITLITLS